MSDTLVAASSGGDMKEDQPESLSVETAQPSLLKKGGLFGNSVAISPKAGDGTPSPAENSSQNGNDEVSSQNKNGDGDSGANGDNQDEVDLEAANGDSAEEAQSGDDEVMLVEEPEEEEEAEQPAEEPEPAVPVAVAAEEPAEAQDSVQPVEVIEDIEMADETDEDAEEEKEAEEQKDETAAADETEAADAAPAAAAAVEPKEDSPEKEEEDKKDEATGEDDKDEEMAEEPKEEEKEEEDEVEEECVKKVISMDTDETDEPAAEEPKADETLPLDTTQADEAEEEAETSTAVATPKRGRGRPPKSASGTPASVKTPAVRKTASAPKTPAVIDEEEGEEREKRTPRGAAKRANEAMTSPPPSSARGRGRRSIKSDASDQPEEEEKKETEIEKKEGEEDAEMKTPPTVGRGQRSLKTTPTSALRSQPKGRLIVEEIEDIEEEDGAEEAEKEEVKEEEEAVEETPRRGRRTAQSTPAAKKETPARGSKSAKKVEEEAEGEEKEASETSVSPSRRSTRGAAKSPVKTPSAKATPKGRGRKSSVKSEETVETEETVEEEKEEEEEEKPRRGGRARKSITAKTPTASAKKAKKSAEDEEDPFDMNTELDKHPEPLRNITVEKGSFGEMKYTRSPAASKSKYAATERSASDKVANLPNTPAATGTPKTIASAQSTRKSLGGSPAKRTPAARRKRGDEEGEEMDEDEAMDEGAMETPHEKKGRGRPAGGASTGRKRKASPVMSSSAKRAAVCVTIPELDAEAQWAADHPEDDSAPLVPGARVFAVFQKIFYPALVGERDGLGRYMVEFVEDKIVRPVPPAGVVPLSAVTIDKECLYQSSPDTDPVQCRVLRSANAASAKEWLLGAFRLQEMNEEDEHDANWTCLQLDMATTEWKKYVNAKSKMVTKINTDNITSLEDRRERRSRVHNDTAVALATLTGTGGTPEPTARRVAGARKTPASAGVAAKSAEKKTPASGGRRGRKPKAAAVAAAAEEDEVDEEEEKKEAETEEKMDTDEEKEEEKPEMNPRIFLNKTFILTSANRTVGDVVFKKNEMKKQILERGGVVVEDINQVPLDAEAYLISDTHYRTHKYLAAMSRGMPCLSHKWLIECVQKEELAPFDEYKLAGGQGLLNGDLYPLPDVRGKLLVGRSIMVHSKTDASMKKGTMGFKQIWSPIVELLGARVISDACLADVVTAAEAAKVALPADFEILLTDSSCQPEVVARMEGAGKAVVSSEWLIQSIIMGACPDFSAHPRFRYDSGNEPAKKEGSQEQAANQ